PALSAHFTPCSLTPSTASSRQCWISKGRVCWSVAAVSFGSSIWHHAHRPRRALRPDPSAGRALHHLGRDDDRAAFAGRRIARWRGALGLRRVASLRVAILLRGNPGRRPASARGGAYPPGPRARGRLAGGDGRPSPIGRKGKPIRPRGSGNGLLGPRGAPSTPRP